VREIALLGFDQATTAAEATSTAALRGLERPTYEDALHFGIEYPDVQIEGPVSSSTIRGSASLAAGM